MVCIMQEVAFFKTVFRNTKRNGFSNFRNGVGAGLGIKLEFKIRDLIKFLVFNLYRKRTDERLKTNVNFSYIFT